MPSPHAPISTRGRKKTERPHHQAPEGPACPPWLRHRRAVRRADKTLTDELASADCFSIFLRSPTRRSAGHRMVASRLHRRAHSPSRNEERRTPRGPAAVYPADATGGNRTEGRQGFRCDEPAEGVAEGLRGVRAGSYHRSAGEEV